MKKIDVATIEAARRGHRSQKCQAACQLANRRSCGARWVFGLQPSNGSCAAAHVLRRRSGISREHLLISSPSIAAGASPLRQQLKRETAALHQRLEAQLGLLEPQLSIRRYRHMLETFYGFYAPVEVCLARLAAAGSQLSFPLRERSVLIENDLRALGLSPRELTELPRCVEVPRLECSENLAGCLYVLEGACLGGQMIARVLHRQFGVARESGASFFVGDGEATSARWRLVLIWLEGLVHAGARSEQIVASARECFLTLSRWVKQQGASR